MESRVISEGTIRAGDPLDQWQCSPPDWREYRLWELAEYLNGRAFKPADFSETGLHVIRITDLKYGISDATAHFRGSFEDKHLLRKDDLLFAWSGNPETSLDAFRWRSGPALLNQHIFRVIPRPGVDRDYLYFVLKYLRPTFIRTARDKATSMGHVKVTDLKRLIAKIPSVHEQRAIAHILGTLDDKIELNRRMNETLEGMARALFKSWFVDFDPVRAKAEGRDPGLPKPIADLFPDSFEDSDLGQIPAGWAVKPLAEFTTAITKGTTPTQEGIDTAPEGGAQIKYVRVNSIGEDGAILFDKLTTIPESVHLGVLKRSVLRVNDVLYTIAGTIGRISVVEKSLLPANSNQAVAIVRPKPGIPSDFLVFTMRQEAFREELHSNIVHAVQANLSLGMLSRARAVVPPMEMLPQLFRPIDDVVKRILANRTESRTLAALRDALLTKLISGELRVKDAHRAVGGDT